MEDDETVRKGVEASGDGPGPTALTRGDVLLSDVPTIGRIVGLLVLVLTLQRLVSLPRLMSVFDVKYRGGEDRSFDVNRVLWLTKGVLRRLFGGKYCMKRSLILFHYLRKNGRDARIVFGVAKDGSELRGHAWVTVDGKPFAEEGAVDRYAITYSYPDPA